MISDPGEELVAIVDHDNNVVGAATRRRMRAEGLPHRATYILVFHPSGKLWVQKRTLTKDVYPGYFDPATGGVVLAGESYEEGAERELAEEMGIRGVPLRPAFDFWYADERTRVWGRVFSCEWGGAVIPQPEEVEFVELREPAGIAEDSGGPFTPDGLYVVRRYLAAGASA